MQALLTLYGISPVCDTMCSRSSIRRLNTSGQAEHVNTCERWGGVSFCRTQSPTCSPQLSPLPSTWHCHPATAFSPHPQEQDLVQHSVLVC